MDLWFLDRSPSSTDRGGWDQVLDSEERARAHAFRTPGLREQYVAAHALVRTVLSAYAALPPEQWRFAYGPKGQPRLAGAPVDLRFSLSHSGPRAAVAVTLGRQVGLDLEEADAGKDALGIGERFFTPAETEALRSCAESERAGRFATLWTAKEAVLKARGVGLASGLATVEVTLDEAGNVRSVAAPDGPWRVRAWTPEVGLRAAVAVQESGPIRIRTFRAVPLGAVQPAPELGPPEP